MNEKELLRQLEEYKAKLHREESRYRAMAWRAMLCMVAAFWIAVAAVVWGVM
jgi:fatty acid desaturase